MSESGGQSEPSMEDILASIRRILNEDGEPVAEGEAAAPAAQDAGARSQSNVDDIFELDQSMIVEETTAAEPAPPPPSSIPAFEEEPLLNAVSAAAAGASLGALARVVDQQQQRAVPVYPGGPTLEDIVRQELRPILKGWLDEHLPSLVERLVRAEIERVTSNRA
jgi:hypothetical protein